MLFFISPALYSVMRFVIETIQYQTDVETDSTNAGTKLLDGEVYKMKE